MVYTAGIDIGSTYTKVIVLNERWEIVGRALTKTGFNLGKAANTGYAMGLESAGLTEKDIAYVASTGYGRYMASFRDIQVTELTCHSRGAHFLYPQTRTILDIGGQDIKAIRIDENGKVKSFRLNDKCAAGTGAFLEKTAKYMGMTTDDIPRLALAAESPVPVSSVCAVFAESEIINHLAGGKRPEDIMAGAIVALAQRAVQLMKRVGLEPDYTLTGGMTKNQAMIEALEQNLKAKISIPPDGLGHLNGALGAALLALRRVEKLREAEEEAELISA
ncbi:MAG TPA: acyl-CoA dehydratase activase [Dehalococcoidia bacterium]|nr:acyl-CoA dehydratase activase [Dehalococcoidia bacterium]